MGDSEVHCTPCKERETKPVTKHHKSFNFKVRHSNVLLYNYYVNKHSTQLCVNNLMLVYCTNGDKFRMQNFHIVGDEISSETLLIEEDVCITIKSLLFMLLYMWVVCLD